jgi:hypothetical protein
MRRRANIITVSVFLLVVLTIFVLFSIWSRRFGARAIEKWATAKGLLIVRAKRRSFVPHWRSLPSRQFQFFRVTVRDRNGADYRAWMRLESDCTEPEILDVIWDDKTPAVQPDDAPARSEPATPY